MPYVNLEFDGEVREVWKDLKGICNETDGDRSEICRNEIENCRLVENVEGIEANS
jgi:hypothetical protein